MIVKNFRKGGLFSWIILALVALAALAVAGFLTYESQGKKTLRDDEVVATVNGTPIVWREFQMQMREQRGEVYTYYQQQYQASTDRSSFWTTTYGQETPEQKLKELALDQMVRIKVEQQLAKQYGIPTTVDYMAFLSNWKKENERRQSAVDKGEAIYGPIQYGEREYYEYVHDNLVTALKKAVAQSNGEVTDALLREVYKADREMPAYRNQDTIQIRKIVIPFQTALEQENAKSAMDTIKARLDKGEPFDTLYKEYLLKGAPTGEQRFDADSFYMDQKNYGLLLQQSYKLEAGQISPVFEFGQAYYLIRCEVRQRGEIRPFAEVKQLLLYNEINNIYMRLIDEQVSAAKIELVEPLFEKASI